MSFYNLSATAYGFAFIDEERLNSLLIFVLNSIFAIFSLDNRSKRSYRCSDFLLLALCICVMEYYFFYQCKEAMSYGNINSSKIDCKTDEQE